MRTPNLTLRLVSIVTLTANLSVAQSKRGESPSENEHCSLAIVSKSIGDTENVCDGKIVREMARNGHVFEQNQLGIASILAIGPDYSPQEARKWFEDAALKGYGPAQVNLAVMYMNGWGVTQNYGAALHWLRTAADKGYSRAYYNLGILYLNGNGVRRDYHAAFGWFQKGADAGDSNAQTNLGYMYDRGLGVVADAATAAEWYRKAAELGNSMGQNNLADLYLRGEGVRQNDVEAFRWFQKAAAQGNTSALIKLAYLYANGRGTQRNPDAAYDSLLAATQAGDQRGQDLLRSLEMALTAEQIERAKARVRSGQAPQPTTPANSMFP